MKRIKNLQAKKFYKFGGNKMDIANAFTDGWNIYSKNFITIILSFLVAAFLSIVTIGVLAIPLFTGFQMLFVKAKRGGEIELKNIFDPLNNFSNLILAGLIMAALAAAVYFVPMIFIFLNLTAVYSLLYFVGLLFLVYIFICWIFAFLLIQDKTMGYKEALKASRDLVLKNNFWIHLIFLVLLGVIGGIARVIPVLSIIFIPLAFSYIHGVLACAYADEVK